MTPRHSEPPTAEDVLKLVDILESDATYSQSMREAGHEGFLETEEQEWRKAAAYLRYLAASLTVETPQAWKALETLCQEATPGPWKARKAILGLSENIVMDTPATVVHQWEDEQGRRCTAFVAACEAPTLDNDANAAFIASARTAVPELLRALKGISAELRRERDECAALVAHRDSLTAEVERLKGEARLFPWEKVGKWDRAEAELATLKGKLKELHEGFAFGMLLNSPSVLNDDFRKGWNDACQCILKKFDALMPNAPAPREEAKP